MCGFPSKTMLTSFLKADRDSCTTQDYSELSNEQFLFILNGLSGLAPYSHEFVTISQDAQVVSGLVSALTSFMQELSGIQQAHWKTEYGPDTTLIVEVGEWAMGVLVVKRETGEAKSKLRRLVSEFEDSFALLRDSDGIEGGAFSEFDQFVRRTFVGNRLSKRTIILKGYDWCDEPTHCESPRWSYGVRKLLTQINDRMTLAEAKSILRISMEEATELVSRAFWNKSIHVVLVPSDKEILMLSEGAGSYLLDLHNPKGLSIDTLKTIGTFDGRSTLFRVLRKLRLRISRDMLNELGLLINEGYIQRITLERKLVLVNECILTMILKKHSKIMGSKTIRHYLELAIARTIAHIPWATRIECRRGFRVTCRIEEVLEISDLHQLSDALESVQRDVAQQVSLRLVSESDASVLKDAISSCLEAWGLDFQDLVV
jgi:hypothetical protein